jgi:sulfotransferase
MKIVFNSPLARSGSTLLQNILAQNPRFYCTPTSGLFKILWQARGVFSKEPEFLAQDPETMKKAFLGFCAGGLENYFSAITDRPVCLDTARGWIGEYDWLEEFYPKPKILVPIRDLRAVLASMEKRWHKFPHLHAEEYGPDVVSAQMATIEKRLGHWLNSPIVGIFAARLLGAIERGHGRHLHIVRFEDLTAQPEETLNKIYDYIEEPRFKHDFSHVQQVTQENDSYYPIYSDHTIRPEVRPVPLDYHDTLGKTISNGIKQSNEKFFSTFYPGR